MDLILLTITQMRCFPLRLKESDLNISVERASEVAKKTERELFHLYKDTDNKYKNKYRSLMFNLKDTKNNVSIILHQVHHGPNVELSVLIWT